MTWTECSAKVVAPSSSVASNPMVKFPSTIGVTVHDWPTWPSEHSAFQSISTGVEGFLVSLSLLSVTENVMGVVTTTSSSFEPRATTGG